MNLNKQHIYTILTFIVSVVILELCLRIIYFQVDARSPLALIRAYHLIEGKIINLIPQKSAGIWQDDPRFGYSHIPTSSGRHKEADFNVQYTIGPNKARITPSPHQPVLGHVLFLGGSYTFGHGVDDNDNYPSILATYWKHWKIDNMAVAGWGTSHAYMTLQNALNGPTPPSIVIYGMIEHHLKRNYIRKHWVNQIAKVLGGHPHFELVDGQLKFMGIVNASSHLVDPPDLREKEIALTKAFLVQMQTMCRQNHVPFVVVFLDYKRPVPATVVRTMQEHDIKILDLSAIRIKGFQNDPHPNPEDHRHIADAIAASFVSDIMFEKGRQAILTQAHLSQ